MKATSESRGAPIQLTPVALIPIAIQGVSAPAHSPSRTVFNFGSGDLVPLWRVSLWAATAAELLAPVRLLTYVRRPAAPFQCPSAPPSRPVLTPPAPE
jgi:hypothetical protein